MQDSQVLQSDLESLQHWERTWDMEFNLGKYQVIHITRSKSPVKSRYFMHNQELESVDAAKYLGVTISHLRKIPSATSGSNKGVKIVPKALSGAIARHSGDGKFYAMPHNEALVGG